MVMKKNTVYDARHSKWFARHVPRLVFGTEVCQYCEFIGIHSGINLWTKTEWKYCWGRNGWLPVISDLPLPYLNRCRFGMCVRLSAYLSVRLGVCLPPCLSFCLGTSLQTGLAHCLPSATWLAWKRLGWNWFEVASKHIKDWCFASTAAPWIVPYHHLNDPLVPVLLQTSWF